MGEFELCHADERVDVTFRRRMRAPEMRLQLLLKRAFDVAASATLLLLTAPLIACGVIATVLSSPGNPFFAAKRWGAGDRLFRCLKLRTMRIDQEAVLAKAGLNDRGPQGRLLVFDRDPRITPVGSFLRKTSIDELPQLWNVLRGEMSMIGPRPLSPYMLEEYPAIRSARGVMRPGISGLWQIRNRMKNASVLDMLEDDGEYVATFDLRLDLRILLATLPRVIEPDVASARGECVMDETRKLILIEFNELSAALLTKFMDEGELPNFKRFYEASTAYTTTAGDDPLEPWVQWPTVHCGVPYREHGALNLGDGARIKQKAIGTVLSDHGIPVGIFGMMNGNYDRPNGYHMPDPWDAIHAPHPCELSTFFNFVARQVRENTRGLQFGWRDTLAFVTFMLRHGLSIETVRSALVQLLCERFRPGTTWKRAAVLDLLQYDLFRYLNRKHRVRFASFFSNSTAHLQHYFWRDMAPEGFQEPPSPFADRSLRDAVRFGYRSMDRLLGRIMKHYPQHRLVLCTGLSQEPWFETTKCTYRPLDFDALLAFAGIFKEVTVLPVMAEKFRLECGTELAALSVSAALERLSFRGAALMQTQVCGATVFGGCRVIDSDPALLEEPVITDDKSVHFGALFYRITAMNSGRHTRDGTLWICNGAHDVVETALPLPAIAPMILEHLGIDTPATMRKAASSM